MTRTAQVPAYLPRQLEISSHVLQPAFLTQHCSWLSDWQRHGQTSTVCAPARARHWEKNRSRGSGASGGEQNLVTATGSANDWPTACPSTWQQRTRTRVGAVLASATIAGEACSTTCKGILRCGCAGLVANADQNRAEAEIKSSTGFHFNCRELISGWLRAKVRVRIRVRVRQLTW